MVGFSAVWPSAVGALAATRLLAAMLLSTAVGAALCGEGCYATLRDQMVLDVLMWLAADVLVRLSARWCGFWRR